MGDADYCKWFEQIISFKTDEVAAGTWPPHLSADLATLGAEMWDAWDDYDRLKNELFETTSNAYDKAATPVMDRLQSLRELIPTLFGGDDAVLGEFGIKREIPSDKEDLFTVASGCIEHWNDITDPAVPPEYLPVEPMFDLFADEYDAFQAAYTAYIAKTRDKEEAQNLFEEKRAACHDAERLAFHWYKGLHMDGEDEWWTQTPWGTVSGGGGEPEPGEPEGVPWPGPMESFTLRQVMGMYMTVEVVLTKIIGCRRCVLEREQDGTGVWEFVTEFDLEAEELLPFREKVPFAGIWHYRATPFNEMGEPGVASEGTVEVV